MKLTTFAVVTHIGRDVGCEADVIELDGMQGTQNCWRVSVTGDIEHQNFDIVLWLLNLLGEPAGANLHALFCMSAIKEIRQVDVLLNSLETSFKLTLCEGFDELITNGM